MERRVISRGCGPGWERSTGLFGCALGSGWPWSWSQVAPAGQVSIWRPRTPRTAPRQVSVQKLGVQIDALRAQQTRTAGLTARILAARSVENKTSVELAKLHAQVASFRQLALAQGGRTSTPRSGPGSTQTAGKEGSPAKLTRSSASGASVSTAANPKLGEILVNSQGLTLYDFQKDKGGRSACYGACAKIWPPLITTGTPQGSHRVEASKLGTTRRSEGRTQVTYSAHPLYTYVGDKKSGEAAGNGITEFGGSWHALHPNGKEAGG